MDEEQQIDNILEILKNLEVGQGKFILDMNKAIQALKNPLPLPEATVSAMLILIGRHVDVHLIDGSLYSGVFYVPPVEPELLGIQPDLLGIQLLHINLQEKAIEMNNADTKFISLNSILKIVSKRVHVLVNNGQWNIVNIEEPQAFEMEEKKNQFQIDTEKIARGEDTRTSLMIKNIPRRYTSMMLMAEIIKHSQQGTYDFLYLPVRINQTQINLGYAFINMVSPLDIIRFYQDFNGRKWDNSEKVVSLSYAKFQGMNALVGAHQQSTPMEMQFRPTLFLLEEQHQERIQYADLNIQTRQLKQDDVESSKAYEAQTLI